MTPASPRPPAAAKQPDDTIKSSADLPILDVVQQLVREKKAIEEYANSAYASLSELRQSIRAEKLACETEIAKLIEQQRKDSETLRQERDQSAARALSLEQRLQELKATTEAGQAQIKRLETERDQIQKQVERMRLEYELAEAEAAQGRRQLQEERSRQTGINAFLAKVEEQAGQLQPLRLEVEKLKAECTRQTSALQGAQQREQSLRDQLAKTAGLADEKQAVERERRELAERLQLVDQIEAELQQQRVALQKERSLSGSGRVEPAIPQSMPGSQSIPLPSMDGGMMTFSCKNCSKEVQVSTRRAGLMSKCPHCGRIVPVPKQ